MRGLRTTDEFLIAIATDALNRYKGALPIATDTWREVWKHDVRLFVEAAAQRFPFDCATWRDITLINDALIAANFEWSRLEAEVRKRT